MSPRAALAALLLSAAGAALAAACTEVTPAPARSEARPMGIFSTHLPSNPRDHMRLALEQDARRREQRFLDAASPLSMWRATRVDPRELSNGRFTPDEAFQIGAQIFNHRFTREVGLGGADRPGMSRFHKGRRGGPDAFRCSDCHWRGGLAGGGDAADSAYLQGDGDRQDSALARTPIALVGAGWVELVAREMTAELARIDRALVASARKDGARRIARLVVMGVDFGVLAATSSGERDTSGVVGVDADLVVRPFGHKGTFATLRDAVEDELAVHHGMQTTHLARTGGAARVGPFGGDDPDGDGVVDEIAEGQLSALTLYVAMQEVPVVSFPPYSRGMFPDHNTTRQWQQGKVLFRAIGCASCHVPEMHVSSTVYVLPGRNGASDVSVDLSTQGGEPRLAAGADGHADVPLFSDLKRHDMGPDLAEPRADRGVDGRLFVTRPLWGLARSRPYLHDARAPTMEDAIRAHDGEARQARVAFERLTEPDRGTIRIFLTSLTRARRFTVR